MQLTKIFSDGRGDINILTDLSVYPELTLFTTKKNMARGGCIHEEHDEYSCIIEGQVRYYIGDTITELGVGESIIIKKNTPHYFLALADCLVAEWGASPSEKKNKHIEFRKIVDTINNA